MKLVLWTLNQVASWTLPALARALAVEGWFGTTRHSVRLGDRRPSDRDGRLSRDGVLSHEEDGAHNEYFVPIAVKSIGDPQAFLVELGGQMTGAGRALLRRICDAYPEHFEPKDAPRFRAYWDLGNETPSFTSGTAMFTKPHAGFYQLIARDLKPGEKAVLVGYSQGGLVARFLAFLDEHLMKPEDRKIAGVITVQAPNAGSPLANSRNADQVALGIFAVLSGVAGFPIPPCGSNAKLRTAGEQLASGELEVHKGPSGQRHLRHFDIRTLCALLDSALDDSRARLAAAGQAGQGVKEAEAQVALLATARKWISGVQPLPDYITAFADLCTANLDEADSVLQLLDLNPFQATYHGAIIGTGNKLGDFVASGRPWHERVVLGMIGEKLGSPIRNAEQAYAQIVMDERSVLDRLQAKRARAVADAYFAGRPAASIAPEAHDFVIPSVSQEMPAGAPGYFLGNTVNPKGTHLSGGNERDEASDRPLVAQMLTEMGKRLT